MVKCMSQLLFYSLTCYDSIDTFNLYRIMHLIMHFRQFNYCCVPSIDFLLVNVFY